MTPLQGYVLQLARQQVLGELLPDSRQPQSDAIVRTL